LRALRLVWVFLVNGAAVYFFYWSSSQTAALNHLLEQDAKNKQVWLYFALQVLVPVVGAIFEVLGSRAAKWLNAGYFLIMGSYFTAIGLLNWAVYEGHLYFFFGLCALAIALVSFFLYRKPKITARSPAA
jgi:hypothetical protein